MHAMYVAGGCGTLSLSTRSTAGHGKHDRRSRTKLKEQFEGLMADIDGCARGGSASDDSLDVCRSGIVF